MARERKAQEPAEQGAPGWMNTYSNMITLLLAFFVLLASSSVISETKWKRLATDLAGGSWRNMIFQASAVSQTAALPKPKSVREDDALLPQAQRERDFNSILTDVKEIVQLIQPDFPLEARREGDSIILRFEDDALFEGGGSLLRRECEPILGYVRHTLIEKMDAIGSIRVEGHTDDVPIHTPRFRDNWELSLSRAVTVLKFLLSDVSYSMDTHGDAVQTPKIDPERVSVAGFGEYHPIAANDTEEGRRKNRRVEIIIEKMPPGMSAPQ